MGATRAVERRPGDFGRRLIQLFFLVVQEGKAVINGVGCVETTDPGGDNTGYPSRCQFPGGGEDMIAVFIKLAENARADFGIPVIELFLHLVFDKGAFLFNNQDFFQPFGELSYTSWIEGPGHSDFVNGEADLSGEGIIDTEIPECLSYIQIGFAGADNTEAALWRVHNHFIQAVDPGKFSSRIDFMLVETDFLFKAVIAGANIKAAFRQIDIRANNAGAGRIHIDGSTAFNGFGDTFKADPQAGITGHLNADQAVIQNLLDIGRMQDGHHPAHKAMFTLVGDGGGNDAVIVAGQGEHASVF